MSALLQDGLVAASDLHYQKDATAFVMVINRFCWEQADETESQTWLNRCLCGLKGCSCETGQQAWHICRGEPVLQFTVDHV